MDHRIYFIFGDLFSNCTVGALVGLLLAMAAANSDIMSGYGLEKR